MSKYGHHIIDNVFCNPFRYCRSNRINSNFFSLTQELSKNQRRLVARRSVIIASAILLLFAIFGEIILSFIGISMPAFSIAGGILLFLTALEMLFQNENSVVRRKEMKLWQATTIPQFSHWLFL